MLSQEMTRCRLYFIASNDPSQRFFDPSLRFLAKVLNRFPCFNAEVLHHEARNGKTRLYFIAFNQKILRLKNLRFLAKILNRFDYFNAKIRV